MKRNGFIFVETIVVLTVTMVALILLYRSYVLVLDRLEQKTYYDNINDVFRAAVVKQMLEIITIDGDYIVLTPVEGNCDSYMQQDCVTVLKELDVNKVYLIKDVDAVIDAPTDDKITNTLKRYLNTIENYKYTLVIQRGDGYYASLKVGVGGV